MVKPSDTILCGFGYTIHHRTCCLGLYMCPSMYVLWARDRWWYNRREKSSIYRRTVELYSTVDGLSVVYKQLHGIVQCFIIMQ